MSFTFGNRPEDVVTDSKGNTLSGVTNTFYPTEADANARTSPLGSATSTDGVWSFTADAATVWLRTPAGKVYPISSAEASVADFTDQVNAAKDSAAVSATSAATAAAAAASAQTAAESAAGLVGAPADTAVATIVGNPASATAAALNSTYAPQPGTGAPGADVQFEGVRTISDDATNVGFLRTAAGADKGTRVYIMPTDTVDTGVGGVIKVFADPFWRDPAHAESYRDFGIYFSLDQKGDTGQHGSGVFWLNSKQGGTDGLFAGKNPDIGFAFQDGAYTAGRFVYLPSSVYPNGATRTAFILGPKTPESVIAAGGGVAVVEFQGDVVFDKGAAGVSGRALKWWSNSAINNLLTFNQLDLTAKVQGAQSFKAKYRGIVLGWDAEVATNATSGFVEIPTVNGLPTGNFAPETAHAGLVYDRLNNKLCIKLAGETSWRVGGAFA